MTLDSMLPAYHEEKTSGFLCSIPARGSIRRVLSRRRAILLLAATRWLIRRLKRNPQVLAALETTYALGGYRALDLAIDAVFDSAPKKGRPKCSGKPLPWPWEPPRWGSRSPRPGAGKYPRSVCSACGYSDGIEPHFPDLCHRCGATWETE